MDCFVKLSQLVHRLLPSIPKPLRSLHWPCSVIWSRFGKRFRRRSRLSHDIGERAANSVIASCTHR
jgi:hypothetical protein